MLNGKGVYKTREIPQGTLIFKEGQAAREAYLIKSGSVSIYRVIDNKKVVLRTMRAGQIVGEMGVITQEPRSALGHCQRVHRAHHSGPGVFGRLFKKLSQADPDHIQFLAGTR
jgi:hypothetical protein